MDGTVHVSIRVRKYLWKEFVYDVCYALYATYMISNALSKRYFKLLPISGIYHRIRASATRFSESLHFIKTYVVLITFLILFGIAGLVYTAGVPIVFFLAATGRIQ